MCLRPGTARGPVKLATGLSGVDAIGGEIVIDSESCGTRFGSVDGEDVLFSEHSRRWSIESASDCKRSGNVDSGR